MPRILRSDRAEVDLIEILTYLQERSPRAADRFEGDFIRRCETLAQFPMMGRARAGLGPGLRSFVVAPYVIYYRPLDDGIEIVRVLHGARDVSGLFDEP